MRNHPPRSRYDTLTDQRLATLLRKGDVRALSQLVSRHLETLKICALGILHDESAAEAVAWETLEWIWEHRMRWNPRKVRTFLTTRAKSQALNRLRKERSERARAERWSRERRGPPRLPDRVVERRELAAWIEHAIDDLPPRQGEAFRLTKIEGSTYGQAADEMGVSPRTVEHHVEAATAKLRKTLGPLRPHRSTDRAV